MVIHGLTRLISDNVPGAIKTSEIKDLFGRKVAIDASMCLYRLLNVMHQQDGKRLVSRAGKTSTHLMDVFYNAVRMLENGIEPVYVFDSKPPMMKSHEWTKREVRKEEDTTQDTKYTVCVTAEHSEECKRLLKAMGIPYVNALCKASAQCAELARAGKVHAAVSEEMDALTFGAPLLMCHLIVADQREIPVQEIELQKVLECLDFTKKQFVDLCILMGCDYAESIKGLGPHRALQLIKKYETIDKAIKHMPEKPTTVIPENWAYAEARELFLVPEVTDGATYDLKWKESNVDEVVQFMVREKGCDEERIREGCKKLSKKATTKTQKNASPAQGKKRRAAGADSALKKHRSA
ncbi:flap endonuclease 1-like protein [Gongronella butleri]|nr:flap endonuclease 1-like protein [Gongronella butleri]